MQYETIAPNIREHTLASGCLLRAVIADHGYEVDRTALEIHARPRNRRRTIGILHTQQIELAIDMAQDSC